MKKLILFLGLAAASGLYASTPTPTLTSTATATPSPTPTPTPTITAIQCSGVTSVNAEYPFENNGNDSSGNGYNLTAVGTVPYSNVLYKQGSYSAGPFSATNYFTVPAAATLTDILAFSVSVWFYNSDNTDSQYIYYEIDGGSGQYIEMHLKNGFVYFNASGTAIKAVMPAVDNAWHLLTFTDSYGYATIYIDATSSAIGQLPFPTTTVSVAYLGAYPGGPNGGSPVRTYLDDFRQYDCALSSAEVSTLAGGATPTPSFTNTPVYSPTPTFTPTNTPNWSHTFTPTLTFTFSPTGTPTYTPTPSATPTNTPNWSATITPTWTPTATPSATQTATPNWSATATPSNTPNYSPTATPTYAPQTAQLVDTYAPQNTWTNWQLYPSTTWTAQTEGVYRQGATVFVANTSASTYIYDRELQSSATPTTNGVPLLPGTSTSWAAAVGEVIWSKLSGGTQTVSGTGKTMQ